MEWYVFAIITMILFAFSNIAMKEMMKADFEELWQKNQQLLAPLAAIEALAIAALLFFVVRSLSVPWGTAFPALVFFTFASLGLVSLLLAIRMGQIAPVIGIVSASSAITAILSVIILKDRLNIPQIAGIALTTTGVLVIIFANYIGRMLATIFSK